MEHGAAVNNAASNKPTVSPSNVHLKKGDLRKTMNYSVSSRLLASLLGGVLLFGCNQPSESSSNPSDALTAPPSTAPPSSDTAIATTSDPLSADLAPNSAPEPEIEPETGPEIEPSETGPEAGSDNPPNSVLPLDEVLSDEAPLAQNSDQNNADIRLEMAGIADPQEAKDFLAQMSTAAAKGDRDAIAGLIRYPFTTYDTGNVQKEYGSPPAFLADFDEIVTDNVLAVMQNASYDDLFVNYQGAMIGNGAVWFMKYDEGVRIKAINSF
ncbi:MAG: hypothetical protein AAF810_16180 [Cyanobacteria bacterium P01_D01_bin.36]